MPDIFDELAARHAAGPQQQPAPASPAPSGDIFDHLAQQHAAAGPATAAPVGDIFDQLAARSPASAPAANPPPTGDIFDQLASQHTASATPTIHFDAATVPPAVPDPADAAGIVSQPIGRPIAIDGAGNVTTAADHTNTPEAYRPSLPTRFGAQVENSLLSIPENIAGEFTAPTVDEYGRDIPGMAGMDMAAVAERQKQAVHGIVSNAVGAVATRSAPTPPGQFAPIPPPATAGEKLTDVGASLTSAVIQFAIAKRFITPEFAASNPAAAEMAAWEAVNQAGGGTPGVGAAQGALMHGIGQMPVAPGVGGQLTKAGMESASFGGIAAAQGGDPTDILTQAAIPIALHAPGMVKTGVDAAREPSRTAAQQDFAAYQQAYEQSRRQADDAAPAEVGHIVEDAQRAATPAPAGDIFDRLAAESQEATHADVRHPPEERVVAGGQREPGAELVPGRGVDEPRDVRPMAAPVAGVVADADRTQAQPQPRNVGGPRETEPQATGGTGGAAAGGGGGGVGGGTMRPVSEEQGAGRPLPQNQTPRPGGKKNTPAEGQSISDENRVSIHTPEGATGGSVSKSPAELQADAMEPDKVVYHGGVYPLHNVTEKNKAKALTASMLKSGWQGRPLLVESYGDGYQGLTGSHRTDAAHKSKTDVPVVHLDEGKWIDYLEREGEPVRSFHEYAKNLDDEDRLSLLRKAGDERAATLYQAEIDANAREEGSFDHPTPNDGGKSRPVEELGTDGGKPTTLDELTHKHDELKPVVTENASRIQLSRVVVPEGQRGQGRGTAFMEDLLSYADAAGKRITLTPSTDFGGSSVSRLRNFYKRFGFIDNKGRGRDLAVTDTMIREPRARAVVDSPSTPSSPPPEAPKTQVSRTGAIENGGGEPSSSPTPARLTESPKSRDALVNSIKPTTENAVSSRAEAERRLLEHYDAYHSANDETQAVRDESAEDDTGGAATTFRRDPNTRSGFPREIEDQFTPEEMRQIKKRRILTLAAPNDQSIHPEAIGGPDALSEHGMGGDRYADMIRRRMEGTDAARVERAKAFARSDGDPETKYLAAYHDTLLPRGEQPEQVSVDPKELPAGTEATVNKLPVRVVDEGGEKVLRDGGDLPDTPVDALGGKIAVDRGSVKRPGERKSFADRLSDRAAEARKRFAARNSGAMPKTGLDPKDIADAVVIGADLLVRGVRGVKGFTEELVKAVGEHVRPHAVMIRRQSREMMVSERTADEVYEKAAAAKVKQATVPQAEGTQTTVRRLTGQAKPEQVRRELSNLAASMSKAQAASKAGYKAGVDESTGMKRELARIVKENLPPEERGKFLTDVAKANNLTQLRHALTKVERVVREVDWREARDELKKTTAKMDVDKLSPALKTKASDLLSPLSLKQLDSAGEARLKSLVEFAERDKDGVIPPALVDAAKAALEKRRPEDMTAQEMRGLDTVLKNVMAQDRLLRELRVGKRYRQVRDAQDEAVAALKSKPAAGEGGVLSRAMFGRGPTDEAGRPMADPKKHWIGAFIERRFNPDALALEFDNGQEHGIFGNLLRNGLRDGADKAYRLFYEGQDHLAAATEGMGMKWGSPKLTEWANERVPFEMERPTARVVRDDAGRKLGIAGDGSTPAKAMTPAERATLARAAWNPGKGGAKTITMTRAQRLHLAAMLSDPETRTLLSRVKFKDQKYTWGFELNDADKTRFLASLTPEERHVMDAMKGWLGGKFMEAQNEVFRRLDGFDRLTNPDYFPRRADRTEIAPDEPPSSASQYGRKYLEEMGQYQDRVSHSLPFLLDNAFEVYRDVTFKGSAFTGQAEHLHAAWSVLGSPRVRSELVRVYGTQVLKLVDEFLKAATMQRGDEGGHIDKAVSTLSANAAKAILWKPRIAAKQLTGVIALMGDLGTAPVAKAVRTIARDPKLLSSTWDVLKEHSGILRDRYEGAANRMISAQYDDRRSALGRQSLLEKIKEDPSQLYKPHRVIGLGYEHALDMMQAMDYVTAVVAYHAARETGLEPAAAAQRASLAISRTQNASSPVEYSGMQNEGRSSSLYRVMSMFSSQNEATYNLLARKVIEYKYGPKDAKSTAAMARDMGLIAGASLVGAAAIDAAFSGSDDKRRETEKAKAKRERAEARRDAVHVVTDMASLAGGPTAGQVIRGGADVMTSGNAGAVNLLPAPLRAYVDAIAGAGQIASGVNGDGIRRGQERSDGQKVMDGAEKLAKGIGILGGWPGLPEGVKAARYGAEKAGVVEERD